MTTAMNPFVNDEELEGWLRELRLSNIRTQFPNLLAQTAEAELSLRDFLIMMCRHELDCKRAQRLTHHLAHAHFPMVRTLADFDFKAQPSVNPDQVRDLEAGRWIAYAENLLLLGPPGVGKTHLVIDLGRAAADHSVLFVTAASLMVQLQQAHDADTWDTCLTRYVKPKMLVIDEFGYLPVPPQTPICCFSWWRPVTNVAAFC